MNNFRKRRWPLVIGVLILAVTLYVLYYSLPISPHKGDGEFQDLSGWIGPIRDRGYHVKFPEFDLSAPFSSEYRFSGLTNVGDRCGVYLIVIDTKGEWWWDRDVSKLGGRLAFRLTKSNGETVVNVDAPLGKYEWWGFKNKRGLYQDDWRSHFYPDSSADYLLSVTYEPPPELSGVRGHVYLSTGAQYSGGR